MGLHPITSVPTGAQVFLDDQPQGTTPTTVNRPGGKTATLLIRKDGYEDVSKLLRPGSGSNKREHFILTASETAPISFLKTMEPTWASVEIRNGLKYEKSWATVVDLLVRKFDLAVLSKENGYMRTAWLFSWTGEMREDYRVRVTIKFSQDRSKVEIKSEANYRERRGWVAGSDTALLTTLKTDLMGTVGRVTR